MSSPLRKQLESEIETSYGGFDLKDVPAWNARTFSSAINGDADLLTLKWLHHEKCPWGVEAFIAAVNRGDLEILRWLREKQCPWDAECYLATVEKKNGEVLQWLRKEKCPLTETTVDLLIQNLKSCYESK